MVKDAFCCQQYAVCVRIKMMNVDNVRKVTNGGKQKNSEKNFSHQTVVHCPRNEPWNRL